MARSVTNQRKAINTAAAWIDRSADLFPDPVDDPDQLQDRSAGDQRPTGVPVL